MSISAGQRTRLGVFMTATGVLIAIFVAIPVGFRLADQQKQFHAFFVGESVSGLEKGAVVKFHGVPIGAVTDIAYDPDNLSRIKAEMSIDGDFPMKVDMYAQVGGISITGIKHVEISGGSDDSPLLKDGAEIQTRQSLAHHITGKAEDIIAKVELLIDHIITITHPDSSLSTIVENVAVITEEARDFVQAVRPRIETGAHSFESIVARLDSITGDVSMLTSNLRTNFSQERFGSIMSSADSSAQSIKRISTDISLIVRQSREDILVAMENLREAVENANELTKILAENPSLLIRSEQRKERSLP
jgi:phospholipid/cholesterol/gamma-HCH transport system substrate-binding protein